MSALLLFSPFMGLVRITAVSLDMTMVAEDRFSLVHTSQAVGMSLAGLLCQLSIPKMLELRQVQEKEQLLILSDCFNC